MNYSYKGLNRRGKKTKGAIDASDKQSARVLLKEKGIYVLEVTEAKSQQSQARSKENSEKSFTLPVSTKFPKKLSKKNDLQISCSTCGSGTMKPTKIGRFSGFLRFIGFLIALPSVAGILFALIVMLSTLAATSETMETANTEAAVAGATFAASLGIGFALFIGCSSLVGGVVGWFLLMKRKVFKCNVCGFFLDRA